MLKKYLDNNKDIDKRVYVLDSCGSVYHYGKHSQSYKLFRGEYRTHVTNCSGGIISARTNILNNGLEFHHETGIFKKCSGEKLFLTSFKKSDTHRKHFYLTEVHKPNGNRLNYNYNEDRTLSRVEAFGKWGKSLGILEYEYGFGIQGAYILLKHNGQQKTVYRLDRFKGKTEEKANYVVGAEREHAPNISYEYEVKKDRALVPKIIRKNLPENRFQEIEYYLRGSNDIGKFHYQAHGHDSPWVGRVKVLKAPVGVDATPIITHKFLYNNLKKEPGSAQVYDAYDHYTKYNWDKNKRLISLERYSGISKYELFCVERMYWGGDKTRDEILLSSRTCENATGEIQYMRAFKYDEYGNILVDKLYGNLSGTDQKPCRISSKGKVIHTGCECYIKNFTYSNNDCHLLAESTENGVTQSFKYKDDTDLLISKLYKFKDKIFKREFYDYDENAVLIEVIEDDGSFDKREDMQNVSERRVRRIVPLREAPVGLPWIVEEKYVDLKTGIEHFFNITVNNYCRDGRLISKELYDGKEEFIGKWIMEYDVHGNLTREVDSIGHETIRFYDANDNKVFEKITNSRVHKEFFYDFSNRLIKVEEVHDDGLRLSESYAYDYLGHKVSSIDIYGNETRYVYDDFGRLAKTILPKVTLEKGAVESSENFAEYNIFNVPKFCTDFKGNTTFIEYNIRGKPTKKIYPDGSQENFIYNLDGSIQRQTYVNGSYTSYEYDHLNRQLSHVTCDQNGNILESKKFTYNTFHLISEMDAGGHVRNFRYNAAGRLFEATKGECRMTYAYDASGRLYKTTEHDGKGKSVSHIQVFDLLDRVIEERQEDNLRNVLTKVSFGYDEDGNRNTATTYSGGVESTTTTTYDSRHQPIKSVDPLGNVTHIAYKYDYKNELGQIVPYSLSTDPMGNVTINIKDAQGRLVCLVQKNSIGECLHKKCMYYDKNGNKCKQVDFSSTVPGTLNEPLVTAWTYDCMNRLTGITEAVGCAEQKQTEILYNKFGQQSEIIKADSVRILNTFDALGRQIRKFSSDGSIDDNYSYDASGNILEIKDQVHSIQTVRTFDSMNRLAEETLGNGLAVSYTYDALNQPKILTFPDQTGVEYVYDGKRLQAVHRLSQNKSENIRINIARMIFKIILNRLCSLVKPERHVTHTMKTVGP
ncbi:MAG: RHS repeat protein [Parachlamydiaceae bacterium]|nr:RHS repeat protein [Parachlamydiaceae bacterium]